MNETMTDSVLAGYVAGLDKALEIFSNLLGQLEEGTLCERDAMSRAVCSIWDEKDAANDKIDKRTALLLQRIDAILKES